ncbi:MAG: hypothetical protein HYU99_00705 [Deltaproteobacteria bacterium]|nr:hypothetical protein [Deltaproteobacteria bacterium]
MSKFKILWWTNRPDQTVAEAENFSAEVEPSRAGPIRGTTPSDAVSCPSFDDEPWKSRSDAIRRESKDEFFLVDWSSTQVTPPPLPLDHGYVRLLLEFLDTVPKECWIDEENEED